MAEPTAVPEKNRRKPETGFTAHVAETLIGKQSRKVAFGVWGFVAANSLLAAGKIDALIYWKMFLTCALLIGFGTVLDDVVATIGQKLAGTIATKVENIVTVTEKTTQEAAA